MAGLACLVLLILAHLNRIQNCILFKDDNLITVMGGIIASSWAILWKMKEESRVEKELFDKFNERYDERFNDILNTLRKEKKLNEILKKGGRKNDKDENVLMDEQDVTNLIIDYFNMCSEEYLWYKKGLISKDIWNAWLSGFKSNLKIKVVKEIWDKELEDSSSTESYYGLPDFLKK
jgi:hypothetical protein